MSEIQIVPLTKPIKAVVELPGSKSITNRALPIAALAQGTTTLTGVLFSDDTRHFMNALKQLGFVIEVDEENHRVIIQGQGGDWTVPQEEQTLSIGNSGTTARFLTAMLTLGVGTYRIDGIERMRQRPIQDLLVALQELGADVRSEYQNGCPPILITANGLPGGKAHIAGNKSSQYLSAILMSAPYAARGVEIEVVGELLSAPYIEMTVRMMEAFGVHVQTELGNRFLISPRQQYIGREYAIEPDASSASYFFAAAAIVGGEVTINGIGTQSLQGDAQFPALLEQMGCSVEWNESSITVRSPEVGRLRGIDVDLNEMSDTTMTLAAVAAFAHSPTTIRNIGHIRIKETDRILATVTELRKLGVVVEEWSDAMRIHPPKAWYPAKINTYDDHRMAMAFSLIGLRVPGITIMDPECVSKTFPNFFHVLEQLR